MRPFTFQLLMLLPVLMVHGQTAPDFSITDTDGQEWNLYDQLGAGKTVMLDFFFVDCIPCQGQSPEVSIMYNDYLAAGEDVLVLGISDRDQDPEMVQFDITYNIDYPTAGTDGGGDTVTLLYQSWFPFFGWPSYGVICPDTTITWGIQPTVPGVQLRDAVNGCLAAASIAHPEKIAEHLRITSDGLHILSDGIEQIRVSDILGREVFRIHEPRNREFIRFQQQGLILIQVHLSDNSTLQLKIFRQ